MNQPLRSIDGFLREILWFGRCSSFSVILKEIKILTFLLEHGSIKFDNITLDKLTALAVKIFITPSSI